MVGWDKFTPKISDTTLLNVKLGSQELNPPQKVHCVHLIVLEPVAASVEPQSPHILLLKMSINAYAVLIDMFKLLAILSNAYTLI